MSVTTLWKLILNLAFLLLFILNGYVYFMLENSLSVQATLFVLSVKMLPLVIFYLFMIKPNYKASLFFCLILMLYFVFVSLAMFEEGARGYLAMFEGLLLCVLFSASFALGKSHKVV